MLRYIAVLVALAIGVYFWSIPGLISPGNDSKQSLAVAAVDGNGNIGRALENYAFHMLRYPDTAQGLKALFESPVGEDETRWKGPYMNVRFEELLDPWNQPFMYRSPGEVNENKYDLWSIGADGQDDNGKEGSDDVKNWLDK